MPQSSFQLDLSNMGSILRQAGPHSLILMDEFGKGTSPASGISLLVAALRHFAKKHSKVFCTTHFLEILTTSVEDHGKTLLCDNENGISALQMAVQLPSKSTNNQEGDSSDDNKQSSTEYAVPLFRLERGVAESSAGLVCANMAGVKRPIVDRAEEIIDTLRNGRPIEPLMEIFRQQLEAWPISARRALCIFVNNTDWKNATDEQVEELLAMVHAM